MTVTVGTGTQGTRFINKDYPVEEGLTLGTTKLSEEPSLIAEEQSYISDRNAVGL